MAARNPTSEARRRMSATAGPGVADTSTTAATKAGSEASRSTRGVYGDVRVLLGCAPA